MKKTGMMLVLAGTLLAGSLAGGGMVEMLQNGDIMAAFQGRDRTGMLQSRDMAAVSQDSGMRTEFQNGDRMAAPQTFCETTEEITTYAVYDGNTWECCGNENAYKTARAERFKLYEPFGLTYDADKDELHYNGKTVRWFEDYYPVGNDMQAQAGIDFFNEDGVVDVFAVRDLNNFVRDSDGSYDPGGKLTGLQEFTEEEFAARDIEAIKNPPLPAMTATTGGSATEKEIQEMAKEYEAFGLTYDVKTDQWYFNGEKVRYFRDILTSNGESLNSGRFRGALRSFGSEDGTVDVYPVRDHTKVNTSGYGTLTGIEAEEVAIQRPGDRVDYAVYEPYGLIFDEKTGCYTYNGSIVRFFNDPVAGVSFTNFFTGTVDIEAVRDGDHRLTGIVECSKEVYDYHTERAGSKLSIIN